MGERVRDPGRPELPHQRLEILGAGLDRVELVVGEQVAFGALREDAAEVGQRLLDAAATAPAGDQLVDVVDGGDLRGRPLSVATSRPDPSARVSSSLPAIGSISSQPSRLLDGDQRRHEVGEQPRDRRVDARLGREVLARRLEPDVAAIGGDPRDGGDAPQLHRLDRVRTATPRPVEDGVDPRLHPVEPTGPEPGRPALRRTSRIELGDGASDHLREIRVGRGRWVDESARRGRAAGADEVDPPAVGEPGGRGRAAMSAPTSSQRRAREPRSCSGTNDGRVPVSSTRTLPSCRKATWCARSAMRVSLPKTGSGDGGACRDRAPGGSRACSTQPPSSPSWPRPVSSPAWSRARHTPSGSAAQAPPNIISSAPTEWSSPKAWPISCSSRCRRWDALATPARGRSCRSRPRSAG